MRTFFLTLAFFAMIIVGFAVFTPARTPMQTIPTCQPVTCNDVGACGAYGTFYYGSNCTAQTGHPCDKGVYPNTWVGRCK